MKFRTIPALLVIIMSQTQARAAINVLHAPDSVRVITETGTAEQAVSDQAKVTTQLQGTELHVRLSAPNAAVKSISLHWNGTLDASTRCLGDTWERSYADLQWRDLKDSGPMPWYFLATANNHTDAYGVKTQPSALCHWTADETGITLIADVRSGGVGVQLGQRTLEVCTVVSKSSEENSSAFDLAVAFCKQMCPNPRLPKMPVYGFNDWNSTYGRNTAEHFERDATELAALCPDGPNRPYMVVDDGWQANRQGGHVTENQWTKTNAKFGSSMADLANAIKKIKAHPGLWYRPLEAWPGAPKELLLRGNKDVFDPSIPAVRERITADMRRFKSWGMEFIKHDFSTFEILGAWGKDFRGHGTKDGWAFADHSKTTAEIVTELYQAIRNGGGDDMVIDGCNTISHLSAGMFELCRIGDDTSGTEWKRTLDYGVNTLAFRSAQSGAFYQADPDMVGLARANAVPWAKNRQWLDLVSRSGTTLIVSWKTTLLDDETKGALKSAFAEAAKPKAVARPIDWDNSKLPTKWLLDGKETEFDW